MFPHKSSGCLFLLHGWLASASLSQQPILALLPEILSLPGFGLGVPLPLFVSVFSYDWARPFLNVFKQAMAWSNAMLLGQKTWPDHLKVVVQRNSAITPDLQRGPFFAIGGVPIIQPANSKGAFCWPLEAWLKHKSMDVAQVL